MFPIGQRPLIEVVPVLTVPVVFVIIVELVFLFLVLFLLPDLLIGVQLDAGVLAIKDGRRFRFQDKGWVTSSSSGKMN